MAINIDEMAVFCKKKGFVYPSSEIYGGFSGFFDYGPLGAQLKRNIMNSWWKYHVQDKEDMVGIDGSIICNPKVWVASGHVGGFGDVMVACKKCNENMRADHIVEDQLGVQAEGLSSEDFDKLIKEKDVKCTKCGSDELGDCKVFNLLFKTFVGPVEGDKAVAYLRGETAQLIFANFKNVVETSRLKLPFGIAQMGKAFRNEIAPRNFLFRLREFEQMEIEYFVHPDKEKECPYVDEIKDYELLVYSAEMQENEKEPVLMKASVALEKGIITNGWHAFWLVTETKWFEELGACKENFRIRQHRKDEMAHYSSDCWDLEYKFPFGWKELQGIADRSDFDLQQHMKHSKKDMSIFDEETKKKVVPFVVAEPSLGVDRAFLVFMFDAYSTRKDEKGNEVTVLKLNPKIAPVQVAVLPLINKLQDKAREVFATVKNNFNCFYDKSGSVGRRYARMDEIGTPICVTVDFDTLEKGVLTLRNRDTAKQVRVKIEDLNEKLNLFFAGEDFENLGTAVEK
ncbi:glycine--tRNA ligase [Candidatus Woesearchaeota archaeon]|jgi:glycyl-tRNA synthetase|nr:glycine--tRNA ligase [Candidatus Woesearchaeota archaeon]MBT6519446.1 glycine--tRNA ligase [Candidatus Woesearchaeota archaeon]MBT7368892.1 glycine--tRNA ligase [Candidatus Woesearchaeota archaeon]